VVEEQSCMVEIEVLFGVLGHFCQWHHCHDFTWVLKFKRLMLAWDMSVPMIAF